MIAALIQSAAMHNVVAVVAVGALVTVLVLLARERRQLRRAAELLVQASELRHRYDALQVVTGEGVLVQSLAGQVLDISALAATILGLDPDLAVGRSVADLAVVLLDEHGQAVNTATALGHRAQGAQRRDRPDGALVAVAQPGADGAPQRVVQVSSRLVPAGHGDAPAVLTTLVDITGRREVEAALRRSELQFRLAMENAPIGLALVGLDWHLMEVNASFAQLLGTSAQALRGYDLGAFSLPEDRLTERAQVAALLAGSEHRFAQEKQYRRVDGQLVWVAVDVALIRTPAGAPDHFVAQARDTTESRLHAELLSHRAMHDPLTGLANRTLLQEVLQAALEQPRGADRVAVLACDLDGFKPINDRFGHAAGDEVLVQVAGVLRAAAGNRGTVARLGGDEFVIVVLDEDSARAVFEVAAGIHAALRAPIRVGHRQLPVKVSIGIALAGPDTLGGGAPSLLAAADAALYRAKAAGRGRTEVYDLKIDSTGNHNRLQAELATGLAAGEIVLHYQPLVELSNGQVKGHEALVRWQHPVHGLLLPAAFLPLAAESGLAVPLGLRVVDEAAAHLARSADPRRWVSVNASADQLGDGEFAARLLAAVSRHRLVPGRLVVELTESSLVDTGTRVRHELTQLRAAGVPILLDDFGTGVSSLSYLRDLPINGIKLDLSFTAGIPDDPAAAKVSRALGALARELNLITIAEGIETEEQAGFLHRNGWRYGQGWLFGAAQPENALG